MSRQLLRPFVLALPLAALCAGSLACETTQSNTEANMGSAYASTKKQMLTRQPDAFGGDTDPATMPGSDAKMVLENYRENMKVEAQQDRREDTGLVDLRE